MFAVATTYIMKKLRIQNIDHKLSTTLRCEAPSFGSSWVVANLNIFRGAIILNIAKFLLAGGFGYLFLKVCIGGYNG